jgi:hypothetical protein
MELLKSALLAHWVPEGRSYNEHFDKQTQSANTPLRHHRLRSGGKAAETIVQKIFDALPVP